MFSNYIIYFNTLSKGEKLEQVCIMLVFFLALFAISGILTLLKTKLSKNKNS